MLLRKYNTAATVLFPLIGRGLCDLLAGAAFAAGDVKLIKDEGAPANTTNLPTDEGNGLYSLALTATELSAARLGITIIDQTTPKVFEDQMIVIDTYGHASAQHPFDLATAQQAVTVAAMNADTVTAAAIAADAIGASELAAGAATEIADAVLTRPISNVEPGGTFRTLYGAIAALVNRRRINAGNLEVYKTDDATVLSTIVATSDAAQLPLKELDPP